MVAAYIIFGHLSLFTQPYIALIMGLVMVFAVGNPFETKCKRATKWLLRISLIGTGFGLDLSALGASYEGLLSFALTLAAAFAVEILAKKWLTSRETTHGFINLLGTKVPIPYFTTAFVVAALINSYIALPEPITLWADKTSHAEINAALFLIGTTITPTALKTKKAQTLLRGLILVALALFLAYDMLDRCGF